MSLFIPKIVRILSLSLLLSAEMNAKAELERANEDIAIRKLQAQAKMDTERMITGVKVT